MRRMLGAVMLIGCASLHAQAPRDSGPPLTRPDRLLHAQHLAFLAYPELRDAPVQVRVTETVDGAVVTFGIAAPDRDDLLALSRPREALLVCETTFDTGGVLTHAVLRGALTRPPDRRRAPAPDGAEPEARGIAPAFGADRQAAFLAQLDLAPLRETIGPLTVESAQFQPETGDARGQWLVTAALPSGETAQLGFEAEGGRLVRLTRVAGAR